MITFGFIGCGKISRFHADVVQALHHEITGVSARDGSRNIDAFAKSYEISNLYYDWRKMIEKQKPDALIVALSWDQTETLVEEIINFGIPCLIEKPVALSSHALQTIMDNTKPYHDRVMVGYNRRFYDFIPKVKEALREKELISVELNLPETADRLIKLKSQKIADHILIYMSSHWLDLLLYLIGELDIQWMAKKTNQQAGYIEAYNGILTSRRFGVPVHFHANFNAPSNISITFNFRDSIYKLCPVEILNIFKEMALLEPTPENPVRRFIPKVDSTYNVNTDYKPGFYNQMKCFTEEYIKNSEHSNQGCTLQDALAVTHLCEKIKSFH